jgi:outer membrane protein assembly factor BamE (lipoprotein component of BamABCDE complex)
MKLSTTLFSLSAATFLFMSGCATPEARIKKNPELFATYPPEIQNLIREGRVDIGFTKDMVRFALGEPNHIYLRTSADRQTEIWAYTRKDRTTDRQSVTASFRVPDGRGGRRTVTDSVWVDVDTYTEYDALRLEFQRGKITAMEQKER